MLHPNCRKCGLHKYSYHDQVQGRGNKINPKIILIGEAPGPEEWKQGIVFIGKAGKKLDSMIKEYGDIFYITNMVKCYPPIFASNPERGFRAPNDNEIDCCFTFLKKEINDLNLSNLPVIMPLGNVALRGIMGNHQGITKEIEHKSIIILNGKTYIMIPNFHPSYILRNPSMESLFKKVIKEAYNLYKE